MYGHITYRSKIEMADRSGLSGAVLCEIESYHNAIKACPIKQLEGKFLVQRNEPT